MTVFGGKRKYLVRFSEFKIKDFQSLPQLCFQAARFDIAIWAHPLTEFTVAPGAAPPQFCACSTQSCFSLRSSNICLIWRAQKLCKGQNLSVFCDFFFGGGQCFSYHPSYRFRSCFANTMGFNFKVGNSLLLYDSTEISILIPFYSG